MATYRFTLTTPDGSQTFGADKIRNWQDIKPSYVVNDTYRGIFREFTSTFEFVGDVRRSIIRAFDRYGYDVEIFLSIYAGNDNGERMSYKEIAYRLKADIQDIEIGDLFVALNFLDSGFVADIMNREDVEVNLELPDSGFITSIDGKQVPAVDKLLWNTRLHDRRLIYKSMANNELTEFSHNQELLLSYITFPFPISWNYKSDPALQNIIPVNSTSPIYGEDYAFSFLLNSESAKTINLSIYFDFDYLCNSGTVRWKVKLGKRNSDNTSVDIIYERASKGYYSESDWEDMTTSEHSASFEYDGAIELEEGESLYLIFDGQTTSSSLPDGYTINTRNLHIEATSLELYPPTNADLILPHELFTQLLQYYTGKETPFYSEFFGRTDLGYDENGPGAGVAVATGKMIRGFPYGENNGDTQTFLNTSFEKAFQAYNRIFNLAATIEVIGNERRLRIEPMSYFRNFEVVADLGNNIREITRKIDVSKIYSDIQFGYQDREYEELNGLFSFNGEMGLSTPLRTESETLEIVNEWRADDIGIEITRRQQYEDDPSKDYRSDDDIFFIDCKILEEGGSFAGNLFILPKRNENYDSVEGIFEPERAYNLDLSPKRCMYNWQEEIKAGLTFKANQKLKYIKGPKNANLISQKTGDIEIIEASDVLISTLKNSKFIPEIIQIAEAPLTQEQWDDIKNNRYGVIAFENKGVKLYGFIISIEFEINKKTANFELLRANL